MVDESKPGESPLPNSSDQWGEMAKEMAVQMQTGPTVKPAHAMLDALHAAVPFAQSAGVLDIGSGTGLAIDILLERFGAEIPANAQILATDFAPGLVAQLQQRRANAIDAGPSPWARVTPAVMDAQDLATVADGAVTHVMAGFVLFMVPDPAKALREALRVLAPAASDGGGHGGGVLAMTTWRQSDWFDLFIAAHDEASASTGWGNLPEQWSRPEGVRAGLEAAGFRDVSVRKMETHMEVKDPDFLADFMVNKMPMGRAEATKLGPEGAARWTKAYADRVRKAEPEKTGGLRGVALVGVGRK